MLFILKTVLSLQPHSTGSSYDLKLLISLPLYYLTCISSSLSFLLLHSLGILFLSSVSHRYTSLFRTEKVFRKDIVLNFKTFHMFLPCIVCLLATHGTLEKGKTKRFACDGFFFFFLSLYCVAYVRGTFVYVLWFLRCHTFLCVCPGTKNTLVSFLPSSFFLPSFGGDT